MNKFTKLLTPLLALVSAIATAQPSLQLPNYTTVSGTQLTNTNNQWVTYNPTQPNNIDLVETRIFKMPKKGMGLMAVDFKLTGADGGTAWYNSGAWNHFANGGKGGELSFTLPLQSTNDWGRPFLVTYGKKGESNTVTGYMYVSAGGGGSTGMSFLEPNIDKYDLTLYREYGNYFGTMIAVAGGGSGGFCTLDVAVNGKSATRDASQVPINSPNIDDNIMTNTWYSQNGTDYLHFVAGGSMISDYPLNYDYCCTNDLKKKNASSYVHNVFDYNSAWVSDGGLSNTFHINLQSVTLGQTGGRPVTIVPGTEGSSNYGNQNSVLFTIGASNIEIIKNGGRGGSGFSGGGAGTSTTNFYTPITYVFTPAIAADMPTSGAGGTGSMWAAANPKKNLTAGDDGWNDYAAYCTNVSISPRTSTNNPQSGKFMYRTITDTVKPVIANGSTLNVYIGINSGFPLFKISTSVTLSQDSLKKFVTDNDSVNTVTATTTTFGCANVGANNLITIIATDFAGNTTTGYIYVNVIDLATPVKANEPPYNPFNPNEQNPNIIDVSAAPYTLTANDFPPGVDGCNGNNVTIHFPPTTFTCANAGAQNISFYYTDVDGNNSPNYTKTFNITYSEVSTLYVDYSATGAHNGSSWVNAFTNLQDALHFGCDGGKTIYIAQGSYTPDEGNNMVSGDRNASFIIPENYKLYGGFPHGGGLLSSRNPNTNPTILSGEIGNTSITTDNSYHVVTIGGNNTVLEGLTIQKGNGGNTGGGALLVEDNTSLGYDNTTIRNCKFLNNQGNQGGAVYSYQKYIGNLSFYNCLFQKNSASEGGAAYTNGLNVVSNIFNQHKFVNCVFNDNTATGSGGAINVQTDTKLALTNCTFGYNSAGNYGGSFSNSGISQIHNTIMYFDTAGTTQNALANSGTITIDYSNIHGSGGSGNWLLSGISDGGHNIDTLPMFIPNLPSQPLNIYPESKCRNRGLLTYNSEPNDFLGNVRMMQDTVDIGAYETNPVVYVAADAPSGGDGTSWATAYNNLNDGLQAAIGVYLKDVWVKEGTYRPDRNANLVNGGRENTFWIHAALKVFGGFAGNESSIREREIGQHPTVLNGDLGTLNDASDNAYHVVTLDGYDVRLDGFIIEAGNANATSGNVMNKNGGGIVDMGTFTGQNSTIANCVIRNNNASQVGGGFFTNRMGASTLNFIQCIFYGNTANRGAAMYAQSANGATGVVCKMYNSTAVNNTSYGLNSGAFETNVVAQPGTANIYAYNSLWAHNQPASWSNAVNTGGVVGYNCYINSDTTCIVSASNPAGADGLIMTADDGFRLPPSSPAINYGLDSLAYPGVTEDVAGKPRFLQGKIDAGAYENFGCLGFTKLYVDANVDSANGNGSSWVSAFKTLNEALDVSNICPQVDSIFIAQGTYYPAATTTIVNTDAAFEVWNPVTILGGYPTGGGARDVAANPVFFSADINTPDKTDNAVHIMCIGAGTGDTTIIDGINFTNGYASKAGAYITHGKYFWRNQGSCINTNQSLVKVNNCQFLGNFSGQGGAVNAMGGSLYTTHCVFDGNKSTNGGGALYANVDTLHLTGNIFVRDTSVSGSGGSVTMSAFSAVAYSNIANNVFAMNQSVNGGGLYIGAGKFKVLNNTFYANKANNYGGGLNVQANPDVLNIFANNILGNNTDGGGNPDFNVSEFNTIANNSDSAYPIFIDTLNLLGADGLWFTADDGLKLKPTSPYINGGDNQYINTLEDIAGATRMQLGKVDLGAYESDSVVSRWYVKHSQTTMPEDGASWATAFTKMENAITAAKKGDTIWVASGIYSPLANVSFVMKSSVKIFGGFEGTEQTQSERDLGLGFNAVLQGNNNRVFLNENTDSLALLDGFVISKGNTAQNGGGILNSNSKAHFSNIVFTDNTAQNGGAMANINSQTELHNIVFYENEASQNGGAVYDSAAATQARNITFYGNTAANGAVLAQEGASGFDLGNSISWANDTAEWHSSGAASNLDITYSLLQNAYSGAGNISATAPMFSDINNPIGFDGKWFTADDGFTATFQSLYLNKGDNTLSAGISKDIKGTARVQNGTVDMGAYENTTINYCDSLASANQSALYVNSFAPSSGTGFSWNSPLKTLKEALEMANNCTSIDSILITEGTYYPTGYPEAEDRTQSFAIGRSNLHIIGGYSSFDTATRNVRLYPTVLSGNINDNNSAADNSFHVLTITNGGSDISLDGLVIEGGTADSAAAPYNYGGGIYNGSTGNLDIRNTIIKNNTAVKGGGIYNQSGTVSLANVLISYNEASSAGAGFYGASGSPVFTNVTLAKNDTGSSNPEAIAMQSGTAQINNSIVFGSINGAYNAQYSLIEGSNNTANGNINATGLTLADVFSNDTIGDYRLKAGAALINAGNNILFTGLNTGTKDLGGYSRLVDGVIDVGAYEFDTAIILSVKLLSFTAEKQNETALLQWQTVGEQNNKGFDIEHSTDGSSWSKIAYQDSKAAGGNSALKLAYAYTHRYPAEGKNFYRLKQISLNGKYEYSPTRMLNFSHSAAAISIYPNPAKEQVTIAGLQGNEMIAIYDATGRKTKQIQAGNTVETVSLSGWANGMYNIQISNKQGVITTIKLVIANHN